VYSSHVSGSAGARLWLFKRVYMLLYFLFDYWFFS
jgi:hypothetical protein